MYAFFMFFWTEVLVGGGLFAGKSDLGDARGKHDGIGLFRGRRRYRSLCRLGGGRRTGLRLLVGQENGNKGHRENENDAYSGFHEVISHTALGFGEISSYQRAVGNWCNDSTNRHICQYMNHSIIVCV